MKEFEDIVRRLREERPQVSELELDMIKQRVRKHALLPRKGQSMRSRLAILLMLVLGMMLSTTGAGLAIQGVGGGDDAASVQYNDNDDEGDVLGEDSEFTPAPDDDAGVTPQQDTAAQPTRQVEAGSDGGELPFTGFAAIPVLLVGVALLGTGLMLRRQRSDDRV